MSRRIALGATVLAAALGGSAPARATAAERLCTESLITMTDGVRLHAWVSRLAPDQKRPVLFMMDSYARGGKPNTDPAYDNACPEVIPDDYVPQGLSQDLTDRFTLVQVSYRGTGSSEGRFDMTGPRTQQDIHAAIAWAAAGPWSTGDVVLAGESGTGFFAHQALHDPHVKAAVILSSCADMYRCFRRGGGYNSLADVYLAGTSAGFLAGLDARHRLGLDANPDPLQQTAAIAQASAIAKTDDVIDDYWRQRSALNSLPSVSIPVLYTTDPFDIVSPYDAFQLTPGAHLVLGMGHQGKTTAIPAAGDRWIPLVRSAVDRFVAHYGLGEDNGAENDPKVTLVTGTGGFQEFRAGRLLVRGEASWPLPQTHWTHLHLGPGPSGSASSLNDGTLAPAVPAGTTTDTAPVLTGAHADLRTSAYALGANAVTDMTKEERTGLSWTTPVLGRDLEVSGPIALRLFASTTAPDLTWSVRLTDVWPDGRSEWVTDGYLRATLRRIDPQRSLRDRRGSIVRPWLTYDHVDALPFAAPVEYRIDVIGTSNVFRAGHRIRLDVLPVADAEADSARTGGAGTVTVLHDADHPSALTLPVIPARCQDSKPLATDTPKVSCASSYRQAVGS
jgi:putative CocE/NonD family hydrolase